MGIVMKHHGPGVILAFLLAITIAVSYPALVLASLLVTKEDAMIIVGDTVAEPTISVTASGMAPPGQKFHYPITGSSANQGMTGSMVINLYDATTMASDEIGLYKTAQDYYTRRKNAILNAEKRSGSIKVEEVTGIGDAAYWTPKSYTLHFMSQGAYVSVKINDLARYSGADSTELENKISTHRRQLAEKIATLIILRLEVR